ncbi:putative phage abortive infection protein [uncultured Cohaesibacter sp.]|uniref:putative phage abortive infection protein n=1 Tax=uncultured Cohaesibacter sp. TaxID=1002546 RepID=UPI002930F630|nr:putative phage abortive infection protein [uncultured Cohaesibacter sp.]
MSNNDPFVNSRSSQTGMPLLLWGIGLIALLFLLLGAASTYFMTRGEDLVALAHNQDALGPMGDFVGGFLNPIYSFLALMALIYTLWQQNKIIQQQERAIALQIEELEATREELKLTREEAEKTSDALEAQHRSMELQSFENKLFSMIDTLNDVVAGFHSGPNNKYCGEGVLQHFNDYFVEQTKAFTKYEELERFGDEFDNEVDGYQPEVRTFLRNAEGILYFIASHPASVKYKLYVSIFSSMLSLSEMKIIFYGCFSSHHEKLIWAIGKIEFHEEIPATAFTNQEHWKLFLERIEEISGSMGQS